MRDRVVPRDGGDEGGASTCAICMEPMREDEQATLGLYMYRGGSRGAFATVLAYRRASALPALVALAAVLAHIVPLLKPDLPPLEPAALEHHVLVLAVF